MKNILLFVYRNHVFFIFLLLECASFWLIVRNNSFHTTTVLSSGNAVSGRIYELNHGMREYFQLRKANEELTLENAALRSLLQQSVYRNTDSPLAYSDSAAKQRYTYIPSKVINNSVNRRNNYLTLDRGMQQGVSPEMAVISSNGIVGVVKDVSRNFASVMSILHSRSSISVRLAGSGYIGSLVWDGRDPNVAQLSDIPNHVELWEGMIVETSGYSAMFPEGIPVGSVQSFELGSGENFYDINVTLNTRMDALSNVYVVNHLMKEEQLTLEEMTTGEDD